MPLLQSSASETWCSLLGSLSVDQLFAELLCKPISAENISNTNILAHISNIIIGNKVTDNMSSLLAPRQLGFGVKGGAEAAIHAARQYLHSLPPDMLLLKLDFSNAFNSIRRDKMLLAVKKLLPELYPLVHSLLLFIFPILGRQDHLVSRRCTTGRSSRPSPLLPHSAQPDI